MLQSDGIATLWMKSYQQFHALFFKKKRKKLKTLPFLWEGEHPIFSPWSRDVRGIRGGVAVTFLFRFEFGCNTWILCSETIPEPAWMLQGLLGWLACRISDGETSWRAAGALLSFAPLMLLLSKPLSLDGGPRLCLWWACILLFTHGSRGL